MTNDTSLKYIEIIKFSFVTKQQCVSIILSKISNFQNVIFAILSSLTLKKWFLDYYKKIIKLLCSSKYTVFNVWDLFVLSKI